MTRTNRTKPSLRKGTISFSLLPIDKVQGEQTALETWSDHLERQRNTTARPRHLGHRSKVSSAYSSFRLGFHPLSFALIHRG